MTKQNTFSRVMRYSLTAGAMVMAAIMILAGAPAWAEGEKPPPTTTANPAVPLNEFDLLLRPLTKDDLKVEAEGWIGLLKEHAIRFSRNKIDVMKAEGDAKTNLLAEATQLQEQQTALMVYCSCCSCSQPLPWLIAVTMRRQSGSAVRSCRLRPPGTFPQAPR